MYFSNLILLGVFSRLVSGVAFINPPDGATQQAQDYSSNAAHKVGALLKIQWSLQPAEESKPLTLVMWEDVANSNPEIISDSIAAGTTTYDWTVATNKTIMSSQAFFFDLYYSPATISATTTNQVAISHYFNITTSAASTSTSTSPTSTSTSPPSSTPSSSSLGTGAIIGIAVGGGALIIAALAAAFFIIRRRKQKKNVDTGIAMNGFPPTEKAPPGYKENHDCEEAGFIVPGGASELGGGGYTPVNTEPEAGFSELAGGGYKPTRVAPGPGVSELDSAALDGYGRHREGVEGRYEMMS